MSICLCLGNNPPLSYHNAKKTARLQRTIILKSLRGTMNNTKKFAIYALSPICIIIAFGFILEFLNFYATRYFNVFYYTILDIIIYILIGGWLVFIISSKYMQQSKSNANRICIVALLSFVVTLIIAYIGTVIFLLYVAKYLYVLIGGYTAILIKAKLQ